MVWCLKQTPPPPLPPPPVAQFPPANPHLLNLPNTTTNREPSVQIPEPRGNILIQTINVLFEEAEPYEAVHGQIWPLVKSRSNGGKSMESWNLRQRSFKLMVKTREICWHGELLPLCVLLTASESKIYAQGIDAQGIIHVKLWWKVAAESPVYGSPVFSASVTRGVPSCGERLWWESVDRRNMRLFLKPLFYPHGCFDANAMLWGLLWLCNMHWNQVLSFLQSYSFVSRFLWLLKT